MSRLGIAGVLRQLRKAGGYTAKEVAELVGKSEKTVSAWETGRGQPDLDTLFFLCDLYRVKDIRAVFCAESGEGVMTVLREQALLEKYRQLDRHGKELVELVAEKELQRPAAVVYPQHGMVAARSGGVRTADRQELEDMEAVYQNLMLPQLEKEDKGEI